LQAAKKKGLFKQKAQKNRLLALGIKSSSARDTALARHICVAARQHRDVTCCDQYLVRFSFCVYDA